MRELFGNLPLLGDKELDRACQRIKEWQKVIEDIVDGAPNIYLNEKVHKDWVVLETCLRAVKLVRAIDEKNRKEEQV